MKTVRGLATTLLLFALPGALLSMLAISSGATPLAEDDRGPENGLSIERASLFADAPYGVDPVVTGPVSAKFRETREAFGCDRAVWPQIPAACYPE
ncbi:MAG TPA: hypothetical protein GX405_14220 [Rhizobiales bacterium]|nr:hypothetical protein [Hyphomicrobiales bacterium]